MVDIYYSGKRLSVRQTETILECLERNGLPIASSCRSGVCQSCILRAVRGVVPKAAAVGLKPSLRERGYFMACLCRPESELELETDEVTPSFESRIIRVLPLSLGVHAVWLRRPPAFEFRAGQFLRLTRPSDGLSRPYSIASTTDSEELELHVGLVRQGRMSSWLSQSAGTRVRIHGPHGDCHYVSGNLDEPLLLAGSGTGLAPLLGVLRTALAAKHRGPIRLYHAARTIHGLYRAELLRDLARTIPNLTVVMSVGERHSPSLDGSLTVRPIEQLILEDCPDQSAFRIFLCGRPELVVRLKKKAYLAGARLERIHSDPFVSAPVPDQSPETSSRKEQTHPCFHPELPAVD